MQFSITDDVHTMFVSDNGCIEFTFADLEEGIFLRGDIHSFPSETVEVKVFGGYVTFLQGDGGIGQVTERFEV
jgi:hypothetical protein